MLAAYTLHRILHTSLCVAYAVAYAMQKVAYAGALF